MSFDTERRAIETYFIAQWSATPYGLVDQPFTPVLSGSVRLNIINGMAPQASIGRTVNVVTYLGVLSLQLFTDGKLGRAGWSGLAESLVLLFHRKTLDATGALVTSSAQTPHVRFSPPEAGMNCHPHVAASLPDAPFQVTTINCPFTRYETR